MIDIQSLEDSLLAKFLRYVVIDTQSKYDVPDYPSSEGQMVLLRLLEKELKELNVKDVAIDQYGYLMASIPSNVNYKVPAIGFVAHVDTSPEAVGKDVKPQIIKNYQGNDIVLPGNSKVVRVSDFPALKNNIGKTIITSDGTTLLGADDKAGIAVIMALVEFLGKNPSIPHGEIKIGFTPDEEIGLGTKYFDVKKFGADFAYTIDGDNLGKLNKETFSADDLTLTVHGVLTHPGTAKNSMVNAIRIMADIIARMPKDLSPETTEKYEPFMHPFTIEGGVQKTSLKIIFRDFKTEGLSKLKNILDKIISEVQALYPKAKIDLDIHEAYRNMHDDLEKDPRVTDYLWEATKRAGVQPEWEPIRGGTDGSKLTAKGLLTPNIFTGSAGHHGDTEWAALSEIIKALEVAFQLTQVWAEKSKIN